MVDLIKDLCSKNKTTIKSLEKELKFGNGTIRRWDDKKPSYDRIAKVAEYFGVSVNYLLGIPSTGNIDMIEQVHGKDAAEAYANGDYLAYLKTVGTQQKKPALTSENELTDLQKQVVDIVLSMSDDQLRQFIKIAQVIRGE